MTTPSIKTFFSPQRKALLPVAISPLQETANKYVERELVLSSVSPASESRKRKKYGNYSGELRAKIARYAIDHGNTAAARHFSTTLDAKINESTVRGMKSAYEKMRKINEKMKIATTITSIPKSPRGRPLKLGDMDTEVCDYIKNLRVAGGIVNSRIVIAAAKGIITARNKIQLSEYGGPIFLDKPWAKPILKRLGMVKRKGTKGVKSLPGDFEQIKKEFLDRIQTAVKTHNIPDSLIINGDQTGSNYVPVDNWTMDFEGSKQVAVYHIDDKRQMTVLLGITKSGSLVPPQLIYQGKSDSCHPVYPFQNDWDITHTESHWSTSDSMDRYIDKVVIPYIEKIKDQDDLPLKQHALCIFDVYAAHRGEQFLNKLQKNNIHVVFVPASCTDQLQPLDLAINGPFKKHMKAQFENYYSNKVANQMKKGVKVEDIKVDLRLSVVKTLLAKRVTKSVDEISKNIELIKKAWAMAGIEY